MNTSRKKIAVCGPSWFTTDPNYPGQSFPEIISKKLDIDLINLARGGCSNSVISLQIDKAIELNANWVVFGPMNWGAIDIPIHNAETETYWKEVEKNFNWVKWLLAVPGRYDADRGLSNIYSQHPGSLSTHEFMTNPTMISESMNNLAFPEEGINQFYGKLPDKQTAALKSFMLNLYDAKFKRQTDCWIISDACRRLQQNKIPFLLFLDPLFEPGFEHTINWLPAENLATLSEFNYKKRGLGRGGPRFHYNPDTAEPFADFVIKKLKLT